MKKLNILISDDYQDNRILLKQICTILGFDTIVTANGEEAVEAVRDNVDIDIVFMDIEMPVMNGIEATMEIKEFRPDIPIVAITAHNPAHFAEKLQSAGFDNFISKPYTMDKIQNLIAEFFD